MTLGLREGNPQILWKEQARRDQDQLGLWYILQEQEPKPELSIWTFS
nr:MAG TPA: hypothetical protein [Caudoviricetes sp.]